MYSKLTCSPERACEVAERADRAPRAADDMTDDEVRSKSIIPPPPPPPKVGCGCEEEGKGESGEGVVLEEG